MTFLSEPLEGQPSTFRSLLSALLDPGAPGQDALDTVRPEVVHRIRDAWDALYRQPQALSTSDLHALAVVTAQWQGSGALEDLHRTAGASDDLLSDAQPADGRRSSLRDLADVLAVAPSQSSPGQLTRALESGATPEMLVLVGQVVGFESILIRLVEALSVLHGADAPVVSEPNRPLPIFEPGTRHSGVAQSGRPRPTGFTRDVLDWEPWIPVPSSEDLTADQRESFASKAGTDSVYFRMLALTPTITRARSALDNTIFVPRDRLPKAERELAAVAASRINDCIFCASVHARKSAALGKAEPQIDALLAAPFQRGSAIGEPDLAPLLEHQSDRWSAEIAAAAALSLPRPTLHPEHLDALRAQGITTTDAIDLLVAAAFFAWANRLMLGFGDAVLPTSE